MVLSGILKTIKEEVLRMSLKLRELLCLPSLKNAKVVAGRSGLERFVSSISVLEHTDTEAFEAELFNNNEFYGDEIVISGLISIKDNEEAQCNMIRKLRRAGEIGLILYYVGIYLPKVSQKMIELADELGFTLIVMPENERVLRYSEVIYEVVEAIVKQEMNETQFSGKLLEQISMLPENQRSVDTMLKILADRTKTSVALADNSGQLVNAVSWPRSSTLDLGENIQTIKNEEIVQEQQIWKTKRPILQNGNQTMSLYLMKEQTTLTENLASQIHEVVQVFMNLWGENYQEASPRELMKAIMNNESVKMRRLGKLFDIDVSAIQNMWLIAVKDLQKNNEVLHFLKQTVAPCFNVSFIDFYDDFIVVLMDKSRKQDEFESLATECSFEMEKQGISMSLIKCFGTTSTVEVQEAYMTVKNYLPAARKVYPSKTIFFYQEIEFVADCLEIVYSGEVAVAETLKQLKPLMLTGNNEDELLVTLAAFLLDAELSYRKAAEKLYLHRNTIKYRINKVNELLAFPVTKIPESYKVYQAIAVWRILGENYKN